MEMDLATKSCSGLSFSGSINSSAVYIVHIVLTVGKVNHCYVVKPGRYQGRF